MELLVLIALIFFFGIGVVFEVIGFIFRILFSGFGLLLGLVLAAVTAIVAVPLLVGLLGFVIPPVLIILGAIFLIILSAFRYRKNNRSRHYRDYRYHGDFR